MGSSLRDIAALGFRRTQALAFEWSNLNDRRIGAQRGRAAILMYHRVLRDDEDPAGSEPGLFVRASTFATQLELLGRSFVLRTLGDLLQRPPEADDPPVAAVTFDDGWRDNLDVAWPIMQRAGVRGTVFLVRDWSAAGRHGKGTYVTPGDVAELARAGMEFGAHTTTHPRLPSLDAASVRRELLESRSAVAEWTGSECRLFAYPFGAHDAAVAAQARQLFHWSVIVGGGWWSPDADTARIPRIGIHEDMSATGSLFRAVLSRATRVTVPPLQRGA